MHQLPDLLRLLRQQLLHLHWDLARLGHPHPSLALTLLHLVRVALSEPLPASASVPLWHAFVQLWLRTRWTMSQQPLSAFDSADRAAPAPRPELP